MTNKYSRQIKVSQIFDKVVLAAAMNKSAIFLGSSGCGKSATIYAAAEHILDLAISKGKQEGMSQEDLNYLESLRGKNVVEFRMANETPASINGVSVPSKNPDGTWTSHLSTPKRYPKDPRWVGIYFFDEIPDADPSTQKLAYQLLNDRRVGDIEFPKGVVTIGAGNRRDDGGCANDLKKTIVNRCSLYEIKEDAQDWLTNYAYANNIHPLVCAFLDENEEMIYTGDMDDQECPSFASARSLEGFSNVLHHYNGVVSPDLLCDVEGLVGTYAAEKFKAWEEFGQHLPSYLDIVKGKVTKLPSSAPNNSLVYMSYTLKSLFLHDVLKGGKSKEDAVLAFTRVMEFFANSDSSEVELRVALSQSIMSQLTKMASEEGVREIKLALVNCEANAENHKIRKDLLAA